MPNHVKNIVRISGSEESIARCSEQIFKGGEFSFENIKPMPEELHLESGTMSCFAKDWINAGQAQRKRIEKDIMNMYGLGRKEVVAKLQCYADNMAKYGCLTWYEWHCDNWGTKWDAYEISEIERGNHSIRIDFCTAWSTPEEVIKTLAEQYPDLTIAVDYADEDLGNNCGSYGFIEGVAWENVGDFDLACDIWGYDPEEMREELEEV